MEKPEELIVPIQERVAARKKLLGIVALAVAFGAALGGGIGYSNGKDAGGQAAEAKAEKIYAQQKAHSQFASDVKYYHLCWSFRHLADKEGQRATKKKPARIEMNEATARECPLTAIPNVKPKIVF